MLKRSKHSPATIAVLILGLVAGFSVSAKEKPLFQTTCPKCHKEAILPARRVTAAGGEKVSGGVLQHRVGEFKDKCGVFTQPLEDLFVAEQPKAREVELKPVPVASVPTNISSPFFVDKSGMVVVLPPIPPETTNSLTPLPPMPPYDPPHNSRK